MATEEAKKEEDPSKVANDEVLEAVAERLRFFFSDANIRQDFFIRKFLIGSHRGDSAPGTVPIEALLRFNTIKQHTDDPEVVKEAVKNKLAETLKLSDDENEIGRVNAFTREHLNQNIPLTLYLQNLPIVEKENHANYAVTVAELKALFEQYGEIAIVKLRFKKSKQSDDANHTDDLDHTKDATPSRQPRRRYPLGACLVEFVNKESCEKAAEDVVNIKSGETVEAKRKLEVGDKTLEVMLLQDYIDGLKKDRGSPRKRHREGQDNNDDDEEDENNDKEAGYIFDWKPGCVIRLQGLGETCDREAILTAVSKCLDISEEEVKDQKVYADFSRGQADGALRFVTPENVKTVAEKLQSGDITIAGTKVDRTKILEGDEEKKYWDDFMAFKTKQMKHRAEEKGNRNKQSRKKFQKKQRRQ